MEPPNDFELVLVETVLSEQRDKHPQLWKQIPYLRVRSREYTGVGCYVNFGLSEGGIRLADLDCREAIFTVNKRVEMEPLPYGLGFAVDIEGGCIAFLELFTYGPVEWNGRIGPYKITPI
jgi:hypothetical protein